MRTCLEPLAPPDDIQEEDSVHSSDAPPTRELGISGTRPRRSSASHRTAKARSFHACSGAPSGGTFKLIRARSLAPSSVRGCSFEQSELIRACVVALRARVVALRALRSSSVPNLLRRASDGCSVERRTRSVLCSIRASYAPSERLLQSSVRMLRRAKSHRDQVRRPAWYFVPSKDLLGVEPRAT